jgi:phosphoribosylformylglycinamidine synthase
MTRARFPVRHGEGRLLVADEKILDDLESGGHIPIRYCDAGGRPTQQFSLNPNGSQNAVAGVCDSTGRVFGLMPHPEAAVNLYQYPDWTTLRESASRQGYDVPEEGDGHVIFRNAFEYVR